MHSSTAAMSQRPPCNGSGCVPRRSAPVSSSSHPVQKPCTARPLFPYPFLGLLRVHSLHPPSSNRVGGTLVLTQGGQTRSSPHSISQRTLNFRSGSRVP